MDNCDLEIIKISAGKLDPPFKPSIKKYNVTVPSDIDKLRLDLQTSDCGASYRIHFGDSSNVLKLNDGLNPVDIEVVAEDGTAQIYHMEITKLSSSATELTDLTLPEGISLRPVFSANIYEYTSAVNFHSSYLRVLPKVPDSKMKVVVNGTDASEPVPLSVGDTRIEICVCSADGTKSRVYTLLVTREQISLAFTFCNVEDQMEYECPVSLTAFYRPVSVGPSEPKHIFSSPYIDMLTRRSKVNPLNECPLEENWRVPELDLDSRMSAAPVKCFFHYRGCDSVTRLSEVGSHAKDCQHKPPLDLDPKEVTSTEWYKKHFASSSILEIETKHRLETQSWELRLQKAIGGDDADELCRHADKQLELYRKRLPQPGHLVQYEEGQSPLECLEDAAIYYATALRLQPRDPALHLRLGYAREQLHCAAEIYGLRRQAEGNETEVGGAKAAGREEEILAICKLHSLSGSPTLEDRLKALDAEYQQLREQSQSAKADYIQTLFIWLSKRAGKDERHDSTGEEDPQQQAMLKYLDAWSLSPDTWEFNLHAGRLLLLQGRSREALQHLQTGLTVRPSHASLRFYTGLAMLEQEEDRGSKQPEALLYLQQGLEHFITQCCSPHSLKIREESQAMMDLLSPFNVQFLRGCLSLGSLLKEYRPPGKAMSPEHVFHITAVLAAHAVSRCVCRGQVAQQLERTLLDAHFALLQALVDTQAQVSRRQAWVSKRCCALSSLIRLSIIAPCRDLLDMQEKVCQMGVVATPHSSHALCLLGHAQLALHDIDPQLEASQDALANALLSFQASIELENKTQSGPIPTQLAKQKWWQDRLVTEKKEEKVGQQSAQPPDGAQQGSGAEAAGRGNKRPRGVPAKKNITGPAPSRAACKFTQLAKPAPSVPRGRATAASGTKAAINTVCCKTSSKTLLLSNTSKAACQSSTEKNEPGASAPQTEETVLDLCNEVSVTTNRWSHTTRLGLARVLSHSGSTQEEACKLYQEIISLAPEVHDAYIELAELLVKTDPLAAVNVYCRFPLRPISEQNFDDAFITGEVVRILMKEELFDHPQLGPNLIAYGKVMGVSCIEKYIDVLEAKFKTNLLKSVYAGVHSKSVEDKDLQDFFKFKCWI